jgi:hypothetical protein
VANLRAQRADVLWWFPICTGRCCGHGRCGCGRCSHCQCGAIGYAQFALRIKSCANDRPRHRQATAGWPLDHTAVSTAQPTVKSQRAGFWWTGLVIYVGWNLTTLLGALIGDQLGDVSRYGLDAAAAAAFLGLLWPRLKQLQPTVVAVGAAVVAAVLMPVLPAGVPVLAAALVAVVVGLTNLFGTTESDIAEAQPDPMGQR